MRILMDVDGPLTNGFVVSYCNIFRSMGLMAYPEEVKTWEPSESFIMTPLQSEEARRRMCSPWVASEFLPRDGALEFLNRVRVKHDVYAVTAPMDESPTWPWERECWLIDRLGFKSKEIVMARDKSVVSGAVMVDDNPDNLRKWSISNPIGFPVIWRTNHNRGEYFWYSADRYEELEEIIGKIGDT